MQLDVAVDLLRKTEASLRNYRRSGFAAAQATAQEICEEMNVEAVLKEKRIRNTKKHFAYESPDESFTDAMQKLEVTFFSVIMDAAIGSLQERCDHMGKVKDKFGVLFNFSKMSTGDVTTQCEALSGTLSFGAVHDVDGKELARELQNLPTLPSANMSALELLTFIQEKQLKEVYPNLWVAENCSYTSCHSGCS
ncbi:hypothetical protein LDENG_00047990 [Lucifuga dentata]|nr:hypothetical protein LDENG_00047990 [Lucifuga dentata]